VQTSKEEVEEWSKPGEVTVQIPDSIDSSELSESMKEMQIGHQVAEADLQEQAIRVRRSLSLAK